MVVITVLCVSQVMTRRLADEARSLACGGYNRVVCVSGYDTSSGGRSKESGMWWL